MIKESKYIIKRIIIGVGICVCLSFINSCNVKASEDYYMGQIQYISGGNVIGQARYYVNEDDRLLKINQTVNNANVNKNLIIPDNYNYFLYETGNYSNPNNNRNYLTNVIFSDTELYLVNHPNSTGYKTVYCKELPCHIIRQHGNNYASNTIGDFDTYTYTSNSSSNIYIFTKGGGQNFVIHTNFDLYLNNDLYQQKNLDILSTPSTSTIESLGIVKNKNQEENVITSYSFYPTFTNFDTTNFTYQYKIGNGDWLGIGISNYSFNINYNTTVYFRVLRKSDNSVVDSRSITITNIMKYNDNVNNNYNVKYTSENRNVHGDQSAPAKLVDTVIVHFEYYPKQSNLKYQFQYVEDGESLSSWNDMPNNDYDRDYTVSENGTLYNRILDENDNVLYSSTFNVNSIGMLLNDEDLSWYETLFGKIDYGNGIGQIFFLPVELLNVYKTAVESGVCSDFNFGSLFGHNLSMPCLDIRSLVGNNIYNFIDLVGAGFIILSLIQFIVNTYDGLVFMDLHIGRSNEESGGRLL